MNLKNNMLSKRYQKQKTILYEILEKGNLIKCLELWILMD